MSSGRRNKTTQQAGENLVCAELSRRGFVATTFAGNVPVFDLLAVDPEGRVHAVQVKAIRSTSWQFDAADFIRIKIEGTRQRAMGRTRLPLPQLVIVLVRLVELGKDEFYLLTVSQLQNLILNRYSRHLKRHHGVRPRSPKSTHTALWPYDLGQFRDKWEIFIVGHRRGVKFVSSPKAQQYLRPR